MENANPKYPVQIYYIYFYDRILQTSVDSQLLYTVYYTVFHLYTQGGLGSSEG